MTSRSTPDTQSDRPQAEAAWMPQSPFYPRRRKWRRCTYCLRFRRTTRIGRSCVNAARQEWGWYVWLCPRCIDRYEAAASENDGGERG